MPSLWVNQLDLELSVPIFSKLTYLGLHSPIIVNQRAGEHEMGSKGLREKNRRTWRIQMGNSYFRSPLCVWMHCVHNLYHIGISDGSTRERKMQICAKEPTMSSASGLVGFYATKWHGHDLYVAETSKTSLTWAGQSWFTWHFWHVSLLLSFPSIWIWNMSPL